MVWKIRTKDVFIILYKIILFIPLSLSLSFSLSFNISFSIFLSLFLYLFLSLSISLSLSVPFLYHYWQNEINLKKRKTIYKYPKYPLNNLERVHGNTFFLVMYFKALFKRVLLLFTVQCKNSFGINSNYLSL